MTFLDFGERDFDKSQTIEPTVLDRAFWKRAYAVALDDLAALVAPNRVVICEGQLRTGSLVKNHSHDARCYERIFEGEFPETRFVSVGNAQEVSGDRRGLAEALRLLARNFLGRKRNFTGESFWARGYFVSTVGLDEEVVREYIRHQEKEGQRLEQLNLVWSAKKAQ